MSLYPKLYSSRERELIRETGKRIPSLCLDRNPHFPGLKKCLAQLMDNFVIKERPKLIKILDLAAGSGEATEVRLPNTFFLENIRFTQFLAVCPSPLSRLRLGTFILEIITMATPVEYSKFFLYLYSTSSSNTTSSTIYFFFFSYNRSTSKIYNNLYHYL